MSVGTIHTILVDQMNVSKVFQLIFDKFVYSVAPK